MAWYDFDNSGSFNFGDIGAGLSQGADYVSNGLFGNYGTDFVTNRGNSYVSGVDTGNIGSTQGLLGSGMDWLNNNKNAIEGGLGLFNAYTGYKTMQNQQDLTKAQLGLQRDAYNRNAMMQDRGIAREDNAEDQLAQGFTNSGLGLYDPNKKKINTDQGRAVSSNYYGV